MFYYWYLLLSPFSVACVLYDLGANYFILNSLLLDPSL